MATDAVFISANSDEIRDLSKGSVGKLIVMGCWLLVEALGQLVGTFNSFMFFSDIDLTGGN